MEKITMEEFALRSVKKYRVGKQKSIHTVYSGFNKAFRRYFDADPVEEMKKLAAEGKIDMHPTRGGARLYLPGESTSSKRTEPDEFIATILG